MTLSYDEYRGVKYFTALDGVRAIAVLMVVTWHVPGRQFLGLQGYRGVTTFFVLSGFLITTLGLREESKTGRLRVSGFFVRRVFRILPLYYLVLLVNVLVVYGVDDSQRAHHAFSRSLPYYLTFMQEYPGAARFVGAPFAISWSLGIEEKFYLVWPVVGFLLLRGQRNGRVAVVGATTIAIVLLGYLRPDAITTRLVLPYVFVLLGCLLAVLLHEPRIYERFRALGRPSVALAIASVTGLVWILGSRSNTVSYVFGVLVALTIAGLVIGRTLVSRALSVRAVVWVGTISYPLYLVHVLGLSFANKVFGVPGGPDALGRDAVVLLVGLVLAVVASAVLHRVVELPMIGVGRRLSARLAARTQPTSDGGVAAPDPAE